MTAKKKLSKKAILSVMAGPKIPTSGVALPVAPPAAMMELDQPLYDTEWLSPGFLFKQDLLFFQRPIGQRNAAGDTKSFADTNMVQCSQLGVPQRFLISSFRIEVLGDASEEDKRRVLERGVFCFTSSEGRAWVRSPLSFVYRYGAYLPEKLSRLDHGVVFNAAISWPCNLSSEGDFQGRHRGDDERSVEFMIRGRIGIRVLMLGTLSTVA